MDKTLGQENKDVGGSNIPDRSLMAPLNVAPGITTDAYVHLQTVISAGSHATLGHRLVPLPLPLPLLVPSALWVTCT